MSERVIKTEPDVAVRGPAWPVFDGADLVTVVGIVLLAVGFWWSWKPGAFLAPGAILIWYGLPTRPAFIARERDGD